MRINFIIFLFFRGEVAVDYVAAIKHYLNRYTSPYFARLKISVKITKKILVYSKFLVSLQVKKQKQQVYDNNRRHNQGE